MIFAAVDPKSWRRGFALLPVELQDGRWLWFEHYWWRWQVTVGGRQYVEAQQEPYEDRPHPTTPPPLRR